MSGRGDGGRGAGRDGGRGGGFGGGRRGLTLSAEQLEAAHKQMQIEFEIACSRPAQKQQSQPVAPKTTEGDYNLWYHKFSGDRDRDSFLDREPAKTRCNVLQESGTTRANQTKESKFCLFFSKGLCSSGKDCNFLHRRPHDIDELNLTIVHDIFGRERHADDRDDMGGVGNFMRENQTLYCGGLRPLPGQNMEECVRKHFGEFGIIEQLRVIPSKSIAFIRYLHRSGAEFAREAMMNQKLDNGELLNIRWATEDPNPQAKAEARAALHQRLALAVSTAHKDVIDMHDTEHQTETSMVNAAAADGEIMDAYPDTDGQYGADAGAGAGAGGGKQSHQDTSENAQQWEEYRQAAWSTYYQQQEQNTQQHGEADQGESTEADGSGGRAEAEAPVGHTMDSHSTLKRMPEHGEQDVQSKKRAVGDAPAPVSTAPRQAKVSLVAYDDSSSDEDAK